MNLIELIEAKIEADEFVSHQGYNDFTNLPLLRIHGFPDISLDLPHRVSTGFNGLLFTSRVDGPQWKDILATVPDQTFVYVFDILKDRVIGRNTFRKSKDEWVHEGYRGE